MRMISDVRPGQTNIVIDSINGNPILLRKGEVFQVFFYFELEDLFYTHDPDNGGLTTEQQKTIFGKQVGGQIGNPKRTMRSPSIGDWNIWPFKENSGSGISGYTVWGHDISYFTGGSYSQKVWTEGMPKRTPVLGNDEAWSMFTYNVGWNEADPNNDRLNAKWGPNPAYPNAPLPLIDGTYTCEYTLYGRVGGGPNSQQEYKFTVTIIIGGEGVDGDRNNGTFTDVLTNMGEYTNFSDSVEGIDELEVRIGTVMAVVSNIGIILSVLMSGILGIKYMVSSVEEKAEFKKDMLPYLIGALLVFGISAFVKFLQLFGEGLNK